MANVKHLEMFKKKQTSIFRPKTFNEKNFLNSFQTSNLQFVSISSIIS